MRRRLGHSIEPPPCGDRRTKKTNTTAMGNLWFMLVGWAITAQHTIAQVIKTKGHMCIYSEDVPTPTSAKRNEGIRYQYTRQNIKKLFPLETTNIKLATYARGLRLTIKGRQPFFFFLLVSLVLLHAAVVL